MFSALISTGFHRSVAPSGHSRAYRSSKVEKDCMLRPARHILLSRHDHALPDWGLFGRMNKTTKTPLWAVWGVVVLSLLLGLLGFASPVCALAPLASVAFVLTFLLANRSPSKPSSRCVLSLSTSLTVSLVVSRISPRIQSLTLHCTQISHSRHYPPHLGKSP